MSSTVLDRPHAAADAPVVDKRVVRRRLGPGKRIPFSLAIGPILLIGLWCLMSATGRLDPRTLSEPWVVVETARELIESGRLQDALKTSAVRAFAGLGLGTVAGTLLALVAGLSRAGEAVIDGPVQVKRAIPTLALLPLLVLWLGITEEMKIITIALAVMLPVYIHTHNGLRSIDGRYAELAETVDIRRSEFIRSVVLPGATPGFLLGMRFAITTALLTLVVVEQINTTSGIGYMIHTASTYGQTEIIVVGLNGLDLELAPGEFVALIGRSGSGKSTLLRALAGLDRDVTGHGSIDVPDRVSVVFQDSRLLPWRRILDNVVFGLRGRDARERGKQALAEVGLAGRERAWPHELSGGEQQRAALARSLVGDPELLLADEPFGALDALTRMRMHILLKKLCAVHQPSVLLVTHDVDEAIVLADRVIVLVDGVVSTDLHIDLGERRSPGDRRFAALRSRLLAELGVEDDHEAITDTTTTHHRETKAAS